MLLLKCILKLWKSYELALRNFVNFNHCHHTNNFISNILPKIFHLIHSQLDFQFDIMVFLCMLEFVIVLVIVVKGVMTNSFEIQSCIKKHHRFMGNEVGNQQHFVTFVILSSGQIWQIFLRVVSKIANFLDLPPSNQPTASSIFYTSLWFEHWLKITDEIF